MTVELIKYDIACKAIAEAKSVDELLNIRDKADALRAAARVAKNKQAEIDMAEIRFRAERHLGEMMEAAKEAGDRHPQGGKSNGLDNRLPTLKDAGIDNNLAKRARKLAATPQREFERKIKDWREDIERSGERVTLRVLTNHSRETSKEIRVAHVRGYDRRVKHFLEQTKQYMKEVQDALDCSDKFSPEAAAFTMRQLDKLRTQIYKLKEALS